MNTIQLDMFQDFDENFEFCQRLNTLEDSHRRTQKRIFAEQNSLAKLYLDLLHKYEDQENKIRQIKKEILDMQKFIGINVTSQKIISI